MVRSFRRLILATADTLQNQVTGEEAMGNRRLTLELLTGECERMTQAASERDTEATASNDES